MSEYRITNAKDNNDIKVKKFIDNHMDEIAADVKDKMFDEYETVTYYSDMFFDEFPHNRMSFSDMEIKLLDQINKRFGTNFSRWKRKDEALVNKYMPKGPYCYFTKHGVGPGAVPKGITIYATMDGNNGRVDGEFFWADKILTTDELKNYEIQELAPKHIPTYILDKLPVDGVDIVDDGIDEAVDTEELKFKIIYPSDKPGTKEEIVTVKNYREAQYIAADHANGWGYEIKRIDEEVKESVKDSTKDGSITSIKNLTGHAWESAMKYFCKLYHLDASEILSDNQKSDSLEEKIDRAGYKFDYNGRIFKGNKLICQESVKDSTKYSYDELRDLEKDLFDYLEKEGIYPEDGTFTDTGTKILVLELYIDGDWKHEHLRTDYLVDEWCKRNGRKVVWEHTKVLEDTGGDWYPGKHTYWIEEESGRKDESVEGTPTDDYLKKLQSKHKKSNKRGARGSFERFVGNPQKETEIFNNMMGSGETTGVAISEGSEAHYNHYNDKVKELNIPQEEIDKIIKVADEYEASARRGIITYDEMDEVSDKLGLKDIPDFQGLSDMWEKVYYVLNRESFTDEGSSLDKYRKYSDAASAFAEVINREARTRRENSK